MAATERPIAQLVNPFNVIMSYALTKPPLSFFPFFKLYKQFYAYFGRKFENVSTFSPFDDFLVYFAHFF